ncbi:MAG: hypothetical protein ABI869_04120 [Actinomycetota bacterium]
MDHMAHEPGTVPDCPECRAFSYEPGWYKTLRAEHLSGEKPLVIPEVEENIEVVVPDPASLEVVLPDLENVRPEEEDR